LKKKKISSSGVYAKIDDNIVTYCRALTEKSLREEAQKLIQNGYIFLGIGRVYYSAGKFSKNPEGWSFYSQDESALSFLAEEILIL